MDLRSHFTLWRRRLWARGPLKSTGCAIVRVAKIGKRTKHKSQENVALRHSNGIQQNPNLQTAGWKPDLAR